MKSDSRGQWCIFYSKVKEPMKWHVMKLQRADDVLVAAKTYDEVYKFLKYKDAWNFAKGLLNEKPEAKYDATVKRVCKARGDAFYLAGN